MKNTIEIELKLINYDEIMNQLKKMKKLIDEICNDEDAIKITESLMELVIENKEDRSSIKLNPDGTITCLVSKKD